jgi:hypothetical protein
MTPLLLTVIFLAAFILSVSFGGRKKFASGKPKILLAKTFFLSLILVIFSHYLFKNADFLLLSGNTFLELIPIFLVSEELFFRHLLQKIIGSRAQLFVYAVVMPFLYASSFSQYVQFFIFLFVLGLFSTHLASEGGVFYSSVYRLLAFLFSISLFLQPSLIVSLLILCAPLALLAFEGKKQKEFRKELSLPPFKSRMVLGGIKLFAIVFVVLFVEANLLNALGLLDTENVAKYIAKQSLLPLIFAVTLAPLGEELLFRGYLQKRVGVIISSAVFSLLHYGFGSVSEIVAAFTVSIVFGLWVRQKKEIYSPILAHALWNLLSISVVFSQF